MNVQEQTRDPAGTRPCGERISDEQSSLEALKDIKARLGELSEYVSYYIAARADALKVTARMAGVYAALGVVALMAGIAFVVSAVVLVCFGIAALLVWALHSLWLGTLVAGVIFLALLATGALLGMRMLKRSSRERTVQKYGSRQQHQRAEYGTDVRQRGEANLQAH
jgi:membrane protein implicated in regulation of membrane protease activity